VLSIRFHVGQRSTKAPVGADLCVRPKNAGRHIGRPLPTTVNRLHLTLRPLRMNPGSMPSTLISSSISGQCKPRPSPIISKLALCSGVASDRRQDQAIGTLIVRPSIRPTIISASVTFIFISRGSATSTQRSCRLSLITARRELRGVLSTPHQACIPVSANTWAFSFHTGHDYHPRFPFADVR
jgi:hypothetical protein